MHLTKTLLAIAIVLVASSDKLATASKKTTAQNGLYADIYNVEDGIATTKMRVPLGDVNQYKKSDFKNLKKTLTNQEERAAVHLPKGFNSLFSGLERFLGFFRGKRRLRIEEV
ncbi:hypothetical protein F442_05487 [Phytophthora nicotianae P10297]|uniref:RxLR effector protein n=6 Tax=Phytophthora nicotianae TaxID=4792 RepID=W2QFI4_PHYN3|nr:hypothetical protein PPTG_09609 [Phytophthora nicotianae INRA-310]ETI51242.1 hypothetical protein F443_05439 [Phytophthora nicotianae P1569]ETK91080.1 hypothetical protein L915_05296 [Phytophthora nicotianae]ETO79984.1 hypothetical protein F444_05484 [Phytophthora nicotianae P1976]ETP48880.1 hypothetical protein F442_05487 [Phytophthora nicotianae P10297]KUF79585.1 hypothetical protein AM587_10016828 [Phytophthora nicotianae]